VHSPGLGDIALALVRREARDEAVLAVGAGAVTARLAALPFDR